MSGLERYYPTRRSSWKTIESQQYLRSLSKISNNDQLLDVTGQYILPGLIDAHVHYEDFAPELFLNHGVTTVLDLGNDFEWIKATSEAIRDGWIPGPRLYYSTPHFDASPPEGSPIAITTGTQALR